MNLTVDMGDIVVLTITFKDDTGALVDPASVTATFRDPLGVSTVLTFGVDAGLTKTSTGNYKASFNPGVAGDWMYRWFGTGAYQAAEVGTFTVHPNPLTLPVSGRPLLSLSDYKSIMGVQAADTRNDAQITFLLPAVSTAIRNYVGTSFEAVAASDSERAFPYDGSGFVDIDECVSVTSVRTDGGVAGQSFDVPVEAWTAMPQSSTSSQYNYLLLGAAPFGISLEMGFERNLDTIGLTPKAPLIYVTARWGWATIPDDVKLAAALTMKETLGGATSSGGEALTGEAIEGWSRQWGNKTSAYAALYIPNKARDLLAPYVAVLM